MPTASDILDQHVTLQYRALDRLYLNLYVPYLMASGGVRAIAALCAEAQIAA